MGLLYLEIPSEWSSSGTLEHARSCKASKGTEQMSSVSPSGLCVVSLLFRHALVLTAQTLGRQFGIHIRRGSEDLPLFPCKTLESGQKWRGFPSTPSESLGPVHLKTNALTRCTRPGSVATVRPAACGASTTTWHGACAHPRIRGP